MLSARQGVQPYLAIVTACHPPAQIKLGMGPHVAGSSDNRRQRPVDAQQLTPRCISQKLAAQHKGGSKETSK